MPPWHMVVSTSELGVWLPLSSGDTRIGQEKGQLCYLPGDLVQEDRGSQGLAAQERMDNSKPDPQHRATGQQENALAIGLLPPVPVTVASAPFSLSLPPCISSSSPMSCCDTRTC